MKLRLTEPGFETYTGQMGVVFFTNGLSDTDVLTIDGIRISAAMGAQWEDGTPSNVGEMYLSSMDMPAHVGGGHEFSAPVENFTPQATPEQKAQDEALGHYTQAALEAVADESGIAGLREIGDKFGVKGKSIVELIDGILKKQVAPTETPAKAE